MRPMGEVRSALVQALYAGAVGTFDVLAAHAGVPPGKAQLALGCLRREGKVAAQPNTQAGAQARTQRGRPRMVYRLASTPPLGRHWELDRTLCSAWR